MAVSLDAYAPFDSGTGSNVTEDTWRKFMRHMLGQPSWASGVLRGIDNTCQVYADSSGMQVKIKTGEVWIRGHWGGCTAEKTHSIAAAHASLARKDRVIARADFTNNRVEFDVLTGTPAGSPTLPSLTQDSGKWEISLAQVDIPATDTNIDSGQITDVRHYVDTWPIGAASTADATATSDTAPDAITGLTVPLSANAFYMLTSFVSYSSSTTADLKLRFTGPSGATAQITPDGMGTGTTTFFDSIVRSVVGLGGDISVGGYGTGSGNKAVALSTGTVNTVDVSGNLALLMAQQTSDATNTVVYTGSSFQLVRLA